MKLGRTLERAAAASLAVVLAAGARGGECQTQKLTADDAAVRDAFGYVLAMTENAAVVGSISDDRGTNSSSVYAYRYESGAWGYEQKLIAPDGAAYVCRWDGTRWNKEAKLTASDAAAGDNFGASVAVSGERAIAFAPYDDAPLYDCGSPHAFDLFVCLCLADLDHSGVVGFGDILEVLAAWGPCP